MNQHTLRNAARAATKATTRTLAAGVAAGITATGWGLVESHSYALRRRSILREGSGAGEPDAAGRSLRIIHLSDIHLMARQKHKIEWIQKLADSDPDFLVLTGDQLSEAQALPSLLEALEPFRGIPGAFVFGSHDYHSPQISNPAAYLFDRSHDDGAPTPNVPQDPWANRDLPWQEMASAFEDAGWINLNNARGRVRIGQWEVDLVGVDDPHINLDEFPAANNGEDSEPLVATEPSGPSCAGSVLSVKIGLTHAPYKRVLNSMVDDGCDLVFAGHTHGGQICIPKVGALVTNCDLEREFASGLFQWPPTGAEVLSGDGSVPTLRDNHGTAWVNVVTGLGTSPYSPVRIACRPEAVQVDLIII